MWLVFEYLQCVHKNISFTVSIVHQENYFNWYKVINSIQKPETFLMYETETENSHIKII